MGDAGTPSGSARSPPTHEHSEGSGLPRVKQEPALSVTRLVARRRENPSNNINGFGK